MTGGSQEPALKRALKFLGHRSRSAAELRAKLTEAGFRSAIVESTLKKLRSLKLLDDETFARSFAQARIEDRGYGPLRLERELRQKGIPPPLVGRILHESFGRNGGKARALALVEKRFRGKDLSDAKTLRRAVQFLRRRGYEDSMIADILNQPLEND